MGHLTDGSGDGRVEVLFRSGPAGDLADDRLIGRFLAGDAAAFEVLVRRHGPAVDRACRAILRDRHEAEDAFQATFLVLARRAGSVRRRDSLAPWLRGVARRVAVRLKRQRERRGQFDRPIARDASTDPESGCRQAEVIAAVREEVERLPARSRLPVVLCDLEGLSYREAADALGVSPDALRGRLARARIQLRGRLVSRGLAPDAALPALILAACPATIGSGLINATIGSAMQVAVGRAIVAGLVPASVATLSAEVIQTMWFSRLKLISVVALSGFLVAVGVFIRAGGAQSIPQATSPTVGAKQSPAASDLDRLQGTWVRIAEQSGGMSRLIPQGSRLELRISGTNFFFGTNTSPEAARLDPARTPKTIELTPTASENSGKTYFGIYALEDDILMVCSDFHSGVEFPRGFATNLGDNLIIDIYKRTGR